MKLHEMKNRTKIQFLKELEVADERWKSNEKYRERYMDGYVEEKLSWEKDLIEKIEKMKIDYNNKDPKEFDYDGTILRWALDTCDDIIKIIKD